MTPQPSTDVGHNNRLQRTVRSGARRWTSTLMLSPYNRKKIRYLKTNDYDK